MHTLLIHMHAPPLGPPTTSHGRVCVLSTRVTAPADPSSGRQSCRRTFPIWYERRPLPALAPQLSPPTLLPCHSAACSLLLLPRYYGSTGATAVHVLTAQSLYTSISLSTPTALPPTSPETFAFALAPNKDIYAIE